jgi:hypothetical protein
VNIGGYKHLLQRFWLNDERKFQIRGFRNMSNLLEKSLILLFSTIIFGISIAYLLDQVIPMLKQIYEVIVKLAAS